MSARLTEPIALFLDGFRRMERGDFKGAEGCFRQSLVLEPHFSEAMANLALICERAGDVEEAEEYYRRALAIRPDFLQAYLNFGVMLMNRKRFSVSEAVYLRALQLAPNSPAVWSNLGVLLACTKREGEAERCYRYAIKLDSSYSLAQFNLSYLMLRQGRFEEGWRFLEARGWYDALAKYFTCPQWRGESLAGKSVVIGFEAGHGDMIQFCRYSLVLKAMGAS